MSETKSNFLKAYKKPIPSIYNTVLQELLVQQHLTRYKKNYQYDPVFALGFVTIYDQLMEGYPSDEDRESIFQAYIRALKEDPQQYRFVPRNFCPASDGVLGPCLVVKQRKWQFWTVTVMVLLHGDFTPRHFHFALQTQKWYWEDDGKVISSKIRPIVPQ